MKRTTTTGGARRSPLTENVYTCGQAGEDEVGLMGDMQLDVDVLTFEKVLYDRDDSGFVLKASEETTAKGVQGDVSP